MRQLIRNSILRTPGVGAKLKRWILAAAELEKLKPGEYYSPITSDEAIDSYALFDVCQPRIIRRAELNTAEIDLRVDAQIRLLETLERSDCLNNQWMKRYAQNDFFHSGDASVLHGMITTCRPRRIVEIGAGFSTLAILDSLAANDLNDTELTVIEPYPERLLSGTTPTDRGRFNLLDRPLTASDLRTVQGLEENDLLLVDSSHVYKPGSDVQMLFDSFYPALASGVLLHVHDIFFPFAYPASWLRRGHHYNEAYMLRAFLQFNSSFEILLWNDLIRHLEGIHLPQGLKCPPDHIECSIYLRRL